MSDVVEENDGEEDEKKGGTSKLLIIIILVVGLAAGAGGGFYFGGGLEGDTDEVVEEEELIEEEEPEIVLIGVTISKLHMPVYSSRKKYLGSYQMSVTLKVETEEDSANVKDHMDEIRHSFLKRIANIDSTFRDNPGRLDVDFMASELKDAVNKVLGQEIVLEVDVTDAIRMR